MSTLRALSFNPRPYTKLLANRFLLEIEGYELLGSHYTSTNGLEWAIYLDGEFSISEDRLYLCSFQAFQTGYKAVVVRPFRGTRHG